MDLDIPLDRSISTILSHQVARGLVDLIGRGALKPGVRLPSTRALAKRIGVARMTVVEAYEWLGDQGYVEARQGSGTVVRDIRLPPNGQGNTQKRAATSPFPDHHGPIPPIDFRPAIPDLASFPRHKWVSTLAQAARSLKVEQLGYGDPLGHIRLRSAIASYLHRSRGLVVDPETVVITAGTAQAVDILLRVLPQYHEIIIEAPGPNVLKHLPESYGVSIREVPIDGEGLQTNLLPREARVRRLAYVIPSHQFPMGCMMSMERRLELLSWAIESNAYIIEDDYDSEFAYDGRPAVPLAKLDPAGRVIYTGTFSKTLIPALRMGFMVVPNQFLERISALKWWVDHGGPILQQVALASWMEEGIFERHIHRMRKLYHKRYLAITHHLQEIFGNRIRILCQPIGMHIAVLLKTNQNVGEIIARTRSKGVGVYAIDGIIHGASKNERGFLFGFGNTDTENIRRGLHVFATECEILR